MRNYKALKKVNHQHPKQDFVESSQWQRTYLRSDGRSYQQHWPLPRGLPEEPPAGLIQYFLGKSVLNMNEKQKHQTRVVRNCGGFTVLGG